MCTTCGCSHSSSHSHSRAVSTEESRMVEIEKDILHKNNQYATKNRKWLSDKNIVALNLLSSPGSGKTFLLTRTIDVLKSRVDISVIEGDQQTTNDADRIKQAGAKALQINTGRGCHLDAHMIAHALEKLAPAKNSLLFIENVGNLVCPALFDLGEAKKVVILSVTEGEDKPVKYPDMFHVADLVVLNKIDLLPHLDFSVDKCIEYARKIKPDIEVIQVSATTGEGMSEWYSWVLGV